MATNFLYYPGTTTAPNTGLVASVQTLLSSDMVGVASSGTVISAFNGNSGVFTSSNTGQAVWGAVFLTWGTSASTGPAAGGNIAGWFLLSPDGGTTFESSVHTASLPNRRPPDFIVYHSTESINSSDTYVAPAIRLPALAFKVMVQNNLGITSPSSATGYPALKLAPFAVQY